jgi:hypothetical protein
LVLLLVFAEHKHEEACEDDGRGHAPHERRQHGRHDGGHTVGERAAEGGGQRPHGGLQPPPLPRGRRRRQALRAPEAREERRQEGAGPGDERQVPWLVARAPRRDGEAVAHEEERGGAEARAAGATEARGRLPGCFLIRRLRAGISDARGGGRGSGDGGLVHGKEEVRVGDLDRELLALVSEELLLALAASSADASIFTACTDPVSMHPPLYGVHGEEDFPQKFHVRLVLSSCYFHPVSVLENHAARPYLSEV